MWKKYLKNACIHVSADTPNRCHGGVSGRGRPLAVPAARSAQTKLPTLLEPHKHLPPILLFSGKIGQENKAGNKENTNANLEIL